MDKDREQQKLTVIEKKEKRKLLLKKQRHKNAWYGFGLFGIVGWSVTIPALIGLGIGVYIDNNFPSPYLFSVMGLITGVVIGCLTAYYWIRKEQRELEKEGEISDEE